MKRIAAAVPGLLLLAALGACGDARNNTAPAARPAPPILYDSPSTTNDEANDQPVGYYGTVTLCVSSEDSGNTYTLDVDVDDFEVSEIYFPRGGNVDFWECTLDEDFFGECEDEDGDVWTFEGEC